MPNNVWNCNKKAIPSLFRIKLNNLNLHILSIRSIQDFQFQIYFTEKWATIAKLQLNKFILNLIRNDISLDEYKKHEKVTNNSILLHQLKYTFPLQVDIAANSTPSQIPCISFAWKLLPFVILMQIYFLPFILRIFHPPSLSVSFVMLLGTLSMNAQLFQPPGVY